MKNSAKKAAVTALVCVTAAGMMTGCGNKKLDGTKTAVTVNKQEIPLGVVSLAARMQQAQAEAMYKMYLGGGDDMSIWSTKMGDDSDETYGENAVTTTVESIEKMCLEKEHASEYDVEITEDEQKALEEAAKNFIAANSEETIAELAVDEDMVKTFLELETYDVKMKEAIEATADIKLDEKEYQQMAFSYASVRVSGDNLSDDDIKTNKENIQKFFDKIKEDPTADFSTLGDEISTDMTATSGTCPTYEEGDDSAANGDAYPDDVRNALRKLEEGELNSEIIKTDSIWYVVRLDSKDDENATDSKKESLTSTKKDDFYNDTTDGWVKKADIKEESKLIKKIKITDNHSFTIQTPTPTPDPDATATPEAEDTADSTEADVTATPEATETPEADTTEEAEATETPAAEDAEEDSTDADSTDAAEDESADENAEADATATPEAEK
ncbi:MAG: FKBP-type peptidylprolyl isomerase [Eubacteriales bacterium]|nr:FKBP-type peptidylprolyl isomerase [Eubacteriales bacterium]